MQRSIWLLRCTSPLQYPQFWPRGRWRPPLLIPHCPLLTLLAVEATVSVSMAGVQSSPIAGKQWELVFSVSPPKPVLDNLNRMLSELTNSRGPKPFQLSREGGIVEWHSPAQWNSVYDWFLRNFKGLWDDWRIKSLEGVRPPYAYKQGSNKAKAAVAKAAKPAVANAAKPAVHPGAVMVEEAPRVEVEPARAARRAVAVDPAVSHASKRLRVKTSIDSAPLLAAKFCRQKTQRASCTEERFKSSFEVVEGTIVTVDRSRHGSYTLAPFRNRSSHQPVVVKVYHDEFLLLPEHQILQELSLLEAVRHPNIVHVLDVFVGEFTRLVLGACGSSLGSLQVDSTNIPMLVRQMLSAVKHLHFNRIIHCNIEPQNLLVSAGNELQLAGFEDARVEREGFREEISLTEAAAEGLHVGRLEYRAPEILLGDVGFSYGVDLWSIGCIMLGLAVGKTVFSGRDFQETMQDIASKVGFPDVEEARELQSLPWWQDCYKDRLAEEPFWASVFQEDPRNLLGRLLRIAPSRRISAQAASMHNYIRNCAADGVVDVADPVVNSAADGVANTADPVVNSAVDGAAAKGAVDCAGKSVVDEAVTSSVVPSLVENHQFLTCKGGRTMRAFGPFNGARSPFSIAIGRLAPEVLKWLRADDVFHNQACSVKASWEDVQGRRVENNVKLEVGIRNDELPPTSVNGLSCKLPFERLQAWIRAFKAKNATAFHALTLAIKASLVDVDHLGVNGQHLWNADASDWAFQLSTVQFMKAGVRFDPVHLDGGASLLLMAIGLWGQRFTHLLHDGPTMRRTKREAAAADVLSPDQLRERLDGHKVVSYHGDVGNVYVATMTGPEHFVEHADRSSVADDKSVEALLDVRGLGPCKVVLLSRCCVFRGSMGVAAPNPKVVHARVAGVVSSWLQENSLQFPSMREICR